MDLLWATALSQLRELAVAPLAVLAAIPMIGGIFVFEALWENRFRLVIRPGETLELIRVCGFLAATFALEVLLVWAAATLIALIR